MVFLFCVATGYVSGGLTGSFYRLVTNKPASFHLISENARMQILGILTLVFAGPVVIMRNAMMAQVYENRPPYWLLLSGCIASGWSFLSGMLVLDIVLTTIA
jgi:hypothetical protein